MSARSRTFAIEFTAWRGLGFECDLMPIVTCGWVTFWWCRGPVTNELSRLRLALAEAAAELRKATIELRKLRK